MDRAKLGVVVTDYKFGKLDDRPDRYFVNIKCIRETAKATGAKLVTCVLPYGYSNSILQNNPNLAAGLATQRQACLGHSLSAGAFA